MRFGSELGCEVVEQNLHSVDVGIYFGSIPRAPTAGWIKFGSDFECQMDAERADFGYHGISLGSILGAFWGSSGS